MKRLTSDRRPKLTIRPWVRRPASLAHAGAALGALLFALALAGAPACAGDPSTRVGAGGASSGDASGGAPGGGGAPGAGGAGEGGVIDVGPSVFAIKDVDHHRNRLLDTLAQRRGASDRCALWGAMTIVEKGVFLTHTDMLGHRSCFDNASVPVAQMSGGACDASSCTCSGGSPCGCAVGSPMALDHVFKIWAVNGSDTGCCGGTDCCNGGGEWHRTFFSADDMLIGALRDMHSGLPEWAESNDFAGPHDPFTQSSETQQGTPRGQTHFWASDSEATALTRNGVEGVSDAHVVEIDNDYNILHDSNPEGTYSFTYGRAVYKRHWSWSGAQDRGDGLPTTFLGNGAPSDISEIASDAEWLPQCGPVISDKGITPAAGGAAGDLKIGANVVIAGSGFAPSGNRVFVRSRSMTVALDASSPLLLAESTNSIKFQLPKDIGLGEAYIYVESASVLTNVVPVALSQ